MFFYFLEVTRHLPLNTKGSDPQLSNALIYRGTDPKTTETSF